MTTPPTKQVTTRDGVVLIVDRDWAPDFPWHRVFKSKKDNTWLVSVNNRPTTLPRALYGIIDPNIHVRRKDTSGNDFTSKNCYLQHKTTLKNLPWKPGTPLLPEAKDREFQELLRTQQESTSTPAPEPTPALHVIPEFLDLTGTGFIVNVKHALGLIDVRDPQIVSVDLLIPDRPVEGRPMSFAFEGEQAQSIRKWAHYLVRHQDSTLVTGPTQEEVDRLTTKLHHAGAVIDGALQETVRQERRYNRLVEKLKAIGFADPERLIEE